MRHSIDDLQNHMRSHPALLEKVMAVMMGEKNNEKRDEGMDPVLNLTDLRVHC